MARDDTTSNFDPLTASQPNDGQETVYNEHFHLPWWWYLLGFLMASLVALQLNLGRSGYWRVIPYVIMGSLFILSASVVWLRQKRNTIVVRADGQGGGTLHIGQAWLPFDSISTGIIIPPSRCAGALGKQLDPMAYVAYHSWCQWLVLIILDDARDPTPYWLISTQHPVELLDALPNNDWATQQTQQYT